VSEEIRTQNRLLEERCKLLDGFRDQMESEKKQLMELLKKEGNRNPLENNSLQLVEAKKKVELETNARIILQQYVRDLQNEIDQVKGHLPGQKFKNVFFFQMFIWAVLMIFLGLLLFRKGILV